MRPETEGDEKPWRAYVRRGLVGLLVGLICGAILGICIVVFSPALKPGPEAVKVKTLPGAGSPMGGDLVEALKYVGAIYGAMIGAATGLFFGFISAIFARHK